MKLPHASSNDPLLFSTTLLLYLVGAFLVVALVALTIALPAVAIFWDEAAAEIIKEHPAAKTNGLLPAIVMAIGLGGAVVVLAMNFVRKLLQIIRTVADGDPFDGDNADRLQMMAWLSLAIQIVGVVLGGIAHWISKAIKEVDIHFDGELTSIILILLLFILARVFRRGAEMRSELEGTV